MLFHGHADGYNCTGSPPVSDGYAPGNFKHSPEMDHFGLMFPAWVSSYIGELPLKWDDGMSYPTLSAKMELSDSAFVKFGDACGKMSYAFRTQVATPQPILFGKQKKYQ